jgi:hypothetical protein
MELRVLLFAVLVQTVSIGRIDAQATSGPAPTPTTQPMPRSVLDQVIRTELGKAYEPGSTEKYHQACSMLEHYFVNTNGRANVVKAIDSLGLDPNIVGRLTRIRLNRQALAGGTYYINERVGTHDVRYFLGIPKTYDRTKPWPLVIKLPTAEAFVNDPKPDPIQVTSFYTAWIDEELARHPDAVVIMPLLHLDELWGPSYFGMNSAIQPMLHAPNLVNIDPTRVYMVGHSMSGHAVWNLALHYPTYFASFNALAGTATQDWQRVRLMSLRNVLPVLWHDADDTVLKVDVSRQLARALRGLKCEIIYDETKSVGHRPSDAIIAQCYGKMRARSRNLYPKQVSLQSTRPDTRFNRNDWVQIYQPMRPGDEQKLFFTRGSGHMVIYASSFMVDATVENNRINATSTNVESMRFYLNDQMVDFSRPVVVSVNRRVRFEGMLKPSLEEMLKDQLFMGRGWRYYTAFVDIDFGADRPATRPATRATSTTR